MPFCFHPLRVWNKDLSLNLEDLGYMFTIQEQLQNTYDINSAVTVTDLEVIFKASASSKHTEAFIIVFTFRIRGGCTNTMKVL